MLILSRRGLVAGLLMLIVAAPSFAQGPAQGPGGGQFAQFREKHKYTFQLTQMVRHIGEIDKDPKYTLSTSQAKQVIAVLQPLRTKPKLTQDQAKDALKGLKKAFTVNQLNAMARIKSRARTGQGQRPMGEGRPGADRAGQSARSRMDANAMKDFNPFYAKVSKTGAGDEFAAQRAKRWNEFFTSLQNKANGKKTNPVKATKTTGSSAKKTGARK